MVNNPICVGNYNIIHMINNPLTKLHEIVYVYRETGETYVIIIICFNCI